jgi:GNAT superfamily N-acetyltransferase
MIRAARAEDVPAIHRLIRELARYEHSLEQVTGTEEDLRRSLFGTDPAVYAHVAVSEGGARGEKDADEGAVVGFALWFLNYSTWTGQHGIYLEDLFVEPAMRGHGYGKALLTELAHLCVEREYARLDWAVLDWNTPSIEFYQSVGARAMDEWDIYRLTGPALTALGSARETRTEIGPESRPASTSR